MNFDIIKTDYLKSLKIFSPYYSIFIGLSGIIMILNYFKLDILEQNKIFGFISTCIIVLYFIVVLLNFVLFTRIGILEFGNEKFVINKINERSEFLISNIKQIKISHEQGKHYSIEANPYFKEIIELNENDLVNLKIFLSENQIVYQHITITSWYKKLIKQKNVA